MISVPLACNTKLNDEPSNCEACMVLSYSTSESPLRWNTTEKVASESAFQDPSFTCRFPSSVGLNQGDHRCDWYLPAQRAHIADPPIRGTGHNKSHGIMVKLIRMNNATKPYPVARTEALFRRVSQLNRFQLRRTSGLRLLASPTWWIKTPLNLCPSPESHSLLQLHQSLSQPRLWSSVVCRAGPKVNN